MANKYLEKISMEKTSMLITQYQHKKTKQKVWKPEGQHPGKEWKPTGVKTYVRKKPKSVIK